MTTLRRISFAVASFTLAGTSVFAGPPKGGFTPHVGGGAMGAIQSQFKPNLGGGNTTPLGTNALKSLPVLGGNANKSPISIPKLGDSNLGTQLANAQKGGKGQNQNPGQNQGGKGSKSQGQGGNGVGLQIASQLLQGLISQIGSGAGGGGGGASGGGDPGYASSGGGDVVPAGYTQQAESLPPPSPPATGNTTALQITEIDRGPAARAGIQKGDVILMVDGKRTRTFDDIQEIMAGRTDTAVFTILNSDNGTVETRNVALANGRIGVALAEVPVNLDESKLTPKTVPAETTSTTVSEQTALQVTEVRAGNAADAGIKTNDVIVGMDGKRISTTEQFVAALKASKGVSEVSVFNPEKSKLEIKKMKVESGKTGLSVKQIPISVE